MLAKASNIDPVASISGKVGDLGDYLREQRQAARLSVRQLASLTGVSNPYLSQVERGLRKPSAEVLQQLAKGLRISAEVLYVRAGILDSEGRPDVEAAIAADPALTDRQRRALMDIYTSFKAETRRMAEPEPLEAKSPEPTTPAAGPPGPATRPARPARARRSVKTAGAATARTTKKTARKRPGSSGGSTADPTP